MQGKTVVFVGKISRSRADIKEEAKTSGLIVNATLNRNVDYLVYGAQHAPSIHVKKARKSGITVITEQEYRELLLKDNKN